MHQEFWVSLETRFMFRTFFQRIKAKEKKKLDELVKWAFQHKKLGICLRWKFLDPQKYTENSFSTMNQCEIIHWHKSSKFHRRKLAYRRQPYWFQLFVNIAEFLLEGRCVTIYRSKSNRETNDTSFHYVPLDSLIQRDNISSHE